MSRPEPHDHESIGAATRALADATAALTRMLGNQVVPEVGEAIATSLREAARGLTDASENVAKRAGSTRAEERRQARVDRTRADLLDAAARVIAAQGYEGASVGDIAAEAGYTKGALYAHFRSKSEVMLALARERLGIALADPEIALPGITDAGVDVDEVTAWLTGTQDDPRLLLSLEFLTYGLRNPEAGSELAALHLAMFDALAAQVARIRAGQGRTRPGGQPTQDDRDDALVVISVLNIAVLEGMLTGSPDTSPAAAARVLARLLAP
jgi:AcrR family transcriptional regulator